MNHQKQQSMWLTPMNALIKAMARLGVAFGPVHILSVPGRKSGQMRATPVSPFALDGRRYVLAGENRADWVQNVRAAGWAVLQRGRSPGEQVRLVEVPVDEREPMIQAYHDEIPGGGMMLKRLHGSSGDSDSFTSLKDVCPVFRIEPAAAGRG